MNEFSANDMKLLDEAVGTQLRLLGSYINKSTQDYARIARFESLQQKIQDFIQNI
ncbi:MAG: hypothetical protein IJ222_07870 [Bacteroidales bacterium]|nr:hypothetical protein [Bacteroidales bacterium]